jgi:hypothetical protein
VTFPVEVVLKGRDFAVTESVSVAHGDPSTWGEEAVREVLVTVLRAIDRVEHPDAPPDRPVSLRGFSWIVEPANPASPDTRSPGPGTRSPGPDTRSPGPSGPGAGEVVLAIEIPMGAAVAGPFAIGQEALESMISRIVLAERTQARPQTIH